MARRHVLRVKKDYFNLIDKEIKTLEVRVGYSQIKKIVKGDMIEFENYGRNCFDVVRINKYENFVDMLEHENSQKIIPGKTKYEILEFLQKIYPEDKERLGVYIIELKKRKEKIKIIEASLLADENRIMFGKLINEAYAVTDYICDDYPKHFKWYWEKTVPAVINGTREIIVCTIDNKIAGVAFLKKEQGEAKICTFLVIEEYRGKGIATLLMEGAFKFLKTTRPLISLANYKLEMFKGIIAKYSWEHTQTLPVGYYNNGSEELVFNGKIE